MVDLAWVHHDHIHEVKEKKVWQEENLILSDHSLISVSLATQRIRVERNTDPEKERKPDLNAELKRWRCVKDEHCEKLQQWGDQIFGLWHPDREGNLNGVEEPERAEKIWEDWKLKITEVANLAIGPRPVIGKKPRERGDKKLARLVEERNRIRKWRNRSTGGERQAANEALKALQKQVKHRVRETRQAEYQEK